MRITAEQLQAFCRGPGVETANALSDAAEKWGVNTALRFAHWLAQYATETQGFTKLRENLNYSAEALIVKFRDRITKEDAYKYGRTPDHPADQVEIANRIYGGAWGARHLGNTVAGDGSRFIGRGLPHVTGRANYLACSHALCGDETLLYRPEFLEQLRYACEAGGWYWKSRDLNALADRNDVRAITMKITGWNGVGDGAGVSFEARCERLRRAILILPA